jgi:hypothetical protein
MRLAQRLAEEALGRFRIPLGREQEVDSLALAINRSLQIGPAALDLHIGFVHRSCTRPAILRGQFCAMMRRRSGPGSAWPCSASSRTIDNQPCRVRRLQDTSSMFTPASANRGAIWPKVTMPDLLMQPVYPPHVSTETRRSSATPTPWCAACSKILRPRHG